MDHAIDLAAMTPAAAWAWLAGELQAAVASARHPLHLVTLATVTADGAADSRTVVVRRFDATAREVWFHTDARSPKAADIRRDPRVCLHWYDAGLRLQVRIAARATLHHLDDVAHRAWAAAMPMSRACYMAPTAPGTVIAHFASAPAAPVNGDDTGFAHFAAGCCHFDEVEILALHVAGHQRVRLRLNATPLAWSVLAP